MFRIVATWDWQAHQILFGLKIANELACRPREDACQGEHSTVTCPAGERGQTAQCSCAGWQDSTRGNGLHTCWQGSAHAMPHALFK